jgi:GntR family transcriptional regulator, transcriptional repressor for pyruvate dehydrogenase complex
MILDRAKEALPRLLVAHRTITDAVRKRDPQNAALWMRRHLHDWRRGFEYIGKDLDQPIDEVYLQSIIANERRR